MGSPRAVRRTSRPDVDDHFSKVPSFTKLERRMVGESEVVADESVGLAMNVIRAFNDSVCSYESAFGCILGRNETYERVESIIDEIQSSFCIKVPSDDNAQREAIRF